MSRQTQTLSPSGTLSAKAKNVEVENVISLRDLRTYFRAELRMSKRDASFMAHAVYSDEATSKTNLPLGWHQAIWGPDMDFSRRVGISDPTPIKAFKNMEMGI